MYFVNESKQVKTDVLTPTTLQLLFKLVTSRMFNNMLSCVSCRLLKTESAKEVLHNEENERKEMELGELFA